MNQGTQSPHCFNCDQSENEAPLVVLQYRGDTMYVCPECLPVLIHRPDKLAGKLPGAEDIRPAPHHGH